jgi:hypothetical protein
MRYMKLLASLAVFCLLAGFALAAQNGNGPSAGTGNCNENCIRNCENQGTCTQQNCQGAETCQAQNCRLTGPQDGTGNQNGNGQNGNENGAQDCTGPQRNGCCRR